MLKRIYYFIFKNKRKILTLRVLLLTAYYRILVLRVPMDKLRGRMGKQGVESIDAASEEEYNWAVTVSHYVNKIAHKTPWESKCLVQALTAQRLMYRRGYKTTLYLGVGTENNAMVAHAWLRCGEFYLTGGEVRDKYAVVAKFMK